MILLLVILLAAFVVPVWTRPFLEFVQVLFAVAIVAYLVFIKKSLDMSEGPGLVIVLWILGSLCALSLRYKEAAREAVQAHQTEYHSNKTNQTCTGE
ncbi:MAG: hypothetical protein K0R57_2467 [Paenibacillaceae bacterium]|jgi:Ca2+/Na+ antiporter|nr:hypothetical protein [Paenibacillaceae bacterium]